MGYYDSLYAKAPDMLLDKIAEVEGLLAKQKAKSGETDSYKFWKSVLDNMKFAWSYMMDTKWIHDKAALTESNNEFLRSRVRFLTDQVIIFETIRRLKTEGKLDEVVANVDAYLNNPDVAEMLTRKKEIRDRVKQEDKINGI